MPEKTDVLVLGTGVDIGIHVVQLYLNDPEGNIDGLFVRTGTSIILASLTTSPAERARPPGSTSRGK